MKKLLPLLLMLSACQPSPPPEAPAQAPQATVEDDGITYDKTGMASWYGPNFHGKKTASGEIYNQNALTAAHRTLPMPSMVRVTNLANDRSIIVRINDRGPFTKRYIIDLSKGAARELDLGDTGRVHVEYLPKETQEYLAQQ